MRKLILSVLLATSVAMPAMAQDRDGRERNRGRQEASSEQRDEARAARRAERAERPQRAERAERQQAVRQQDGDRQAVRPSVVLRERGERRNAGQRQSNNDGMIAAIERQQAAARASGQRQSFEQRRDDRRDGRVRDGSWNRPGQVVDNRDNRDNRDRYGHRYSGSSRQWNNHWRGDRNYDWRNYRQRNRSVFRLGNYFDPYGSRYRRFSIGFSLFPSYYQSNYWLSDPWQYRLPPAYGPYRWVRYYNDALLVNIYTGQVVDVEHGFFW